ncbi:GreA/GreB family elongation factor [Amycolatopsis azurea]|uniref:Transcription elongation factor GreA n=1 Tax=Amycolatopsis azurea DSM 43854 TaxID=1238180 RepID=M2QIG4_9PSEU|nr:GreA/GreB family elongation factor [Amycolatopsis azurea]EMD25727.1 Transcription elongation factor GreA [Amycolatopsis azurea DSM 43854]OOC02605.1 transcription elongation factor GreAB [Amycolatopsis azurea DSM 43854]
MTMVSSGPWLTPETHARLVRELAALRRAAAVERDGDDEIALHTHRQSRIRQIEDVLRVAVVGQDPPDDGVAEPGMVLTVEYDDGDTETFLLGMRDEAGHRDLEVYSPDSPIGRALHGAKPGDRREYRVPSGGAVHVTLVRAEPYGRHRGATR